MVGMLGMPGRVDAAGTGPVAAARASPARSAGATGVAQHDHGLLALPVQGQHGAHPAGAAVVPGDLPALELAGVPGQPDLAGARLRPPAPGRPSPAPVSASTAEANRAMSSAVVQVDVPAGREPRAVPVGGPPAVVLVAIERAVRDVGLGGGEGGRGHAQRLQDPLRWPGSASPRTSAARASAWPSRDMPRLEYAYSPWFFSSIGAAGLDHSRDRDLVRVLVARRRRARLPIREVGGMDGRPELWVASSNRVTSPAGVPASSGRC